MIERLAMPDVLVKTAAQVGEGPVIDARTGLLCWVDITAGEFHQTDPVTGTTQTSRFETLLGAVAPRTCGAGFAAAVADGFAYLDDGEMRVVEGILADPVLRMNDAKCDPRGRLWAGSTHVEFVAGRGTLHSWDGQKVRDIHTGLTLPNGIGWSADGRRMFLVDSMRRTILVADFDLDDGAVGEFRVFCTLEALPDGLAVDTENNLWVALWGAARVTRVCAKGTVTGTIEMPVSQPSSCAFGPDGTLYITSARAGLSDLDLESEPLAGSMFALATSACGVPVAGFAG